MDRSSSFYESSPARQRIVMESVNSVSEGDLNSYFTDGAGLIIGPELWLPAA
jgi:hypothetical protein